MHNVVTNVNGNARVYVHACVFVHVKAISTRACQIPVRVDVRSNMSSVFQILLMVGAPEVIQFHLVLVLRPVRHLLSSSPVLAELRGQV